MPALDPFISYFAIINVRTLVCSTCGGVGSIRLKALSHLLSPDPLSVKWVDQPWEIRAFDLHFIVGTAHILSEENANSFYRKKTFSK